MEFPDLKNTRAALTALESIPSAEHLCFEMIYSAIARAGHEIHLLLRDDRNSPLSHELALRMYAGARLALETLLIRGTSEEKAFAEQTLHCYDKHHVPGKQSRPPEPPAETHAEELQKVACA